MGHWVSLQTPSGTISAWRADPPAASRGQVVVVQEIFGVSLMPVSGTRSRKGSCDGGRARCTASMTLL